MAEMCLNKFRVQFADDFKTMFSSLDSPLSMLNSHDFDSFVIEVSAIIMVKVTGRRMLVKLSLACTGMLDQRQTIHLSSNSLSESGVHVLQDYETP